MSAEPEFGSYDWAVGSGGVLEARRRLRFLPTVAASAPAFFYDRWFRRRPGEHRYTVEELRPGPPDPAVLAQATSEAAQRQSPAVTGHGLRTWRFGYALAKVDEMAEHLDRNWFCVAALLHDAGLMSPVPGRCFTLGSAEAVEQVGLMIGADKDTRLQLKNAVVDHATPGITKADTARLMAVYLQKGTMADLTGYGLRSLPGELVQEVFDEYDRGEVAGEIAARWRAEAAAVPGGRADFLDRWSKISYFFAKPSREIRDRVGD